MHFPLVTIAIPTYNRSNLLERTIESVNNQKYTNLEILISDDCSPEDKTAKLVRLWMEKDKRISFFQQEVNLGYEANFEFLLEKSQGKYIMWLSDDDLLAPDAIYEFVGAMSANKNAILCASDVQVIDENSRPLRLEKLSSLYENTSWLITRKLFFSYPTSNIYLAIVGMYRTDFFKSYKIKQEASCDGLYTNLEVPYLARLSLLGEIIAVPKTLFLYRSHSDSTYVKEVVAMSWLDAFRLRLCIRLRLFSLIIKSEITIIDKLLLIKIVVVSMLKQQVITLYGSVGGLIPPKYRALLKRIMKKSK